MFFEELPSLIRHEILNLLSEDFNDLRNFSYTCKFIREEVLNSIKKFYIPHLDISHCHGQDETQDMKKAKQILSFKVDASQCRQDLNTKYHNLGNVRSLEIRRINGSKLEEELDHCTTYFKSLEILKMSLILRNISTIRNSFINHVYQHDDFLTGGPITPIDYLVNSGISHLFNDLLIITHDVDFKLKELEIDILHQEGFDWTNAELDHSQMSRLDVQCMKRCLEEIIKILVEDGEVKVFHKFSNRITVRGIPLFFFDNVMELATKYLDLQTQSWPASSRGKHFNIKTEKSEQKFDLNIDFHYDY